MKTKTCIVCKKEKPVTEFHKQRNGYRSKCKPCRSATRAPNNPEVVKRAKEKYKNTEKGQQKIQEYNRSDRHKEAIGNWEQSNPEKVDGRRECHKAIKRGDLIRQPCEKCGASKVDAHHDDYTKPLKVRWLCRKCHRLHHLQLTRQA